MARQLYDYWFVQFDFPDENGRPYKSSGGKMVWNDKLKREIPQGWEISLLETLISTNRGISYNTASISGNGIPMLNLATFNIDGTFKEKGLKTYSGSYSKDKVLQPMDLVMCNTQQTAIDFDKDIIGKAFLVPFCFEGDVVSSHHVTTIETKNKHLKPYLCYLSRTVHFHRYAAGCTTGTNITGLNFTGLGKYAMELPPESVLKKFADFIENIERRKSIIMLEISNLLTQRDELLPLLMNGQVSVMPPEVNCDLYATYRHVLSSDSRSRETQKWMKRLQIIDTTTITLFSSLLFKGVGRPPRYRQKERWHQGTYRHTCQ